MTTPDRRRTSLLGWSLRRLVSLYLLVALCAAVVGWNGGEAYFNEVLCTPQATDCDLGLLYATGWAAGAVVAAVIVLFLVIEGVDWLQRRRARKQGVVSS